VKERKQTYTKYKTRQNNNYYLEIVIIIIIIFSRSIGVSPLSNVRVDSSAAGGWQRYV
jgi:hypothetical protein